VIVGIDERSLARFGRWPWPRSRLAELIERLQKYDVRTIAFDAVFDQPDLPNDARFTAAIRASGRVVLGEFFSFDEPSTGDTPMFNELSVRDRGGLVQNIRAATAFHGPIPALQGGRRRRRPLSTSFPTPTGSFRRVPLAIRMGDAVAPALAVAALRHWLGGRDALLTLAGTGDTKLAVGDHVLVLDDTSDLRIDFLGPPGTILNVSALEYSRTRVARPALEGKLVLIAHRPRWASTRGRRRSRGRRRAWRSMRASSTT
jgi:adenylate cyclase